jgi:hypothetical protein
MAEPDAELRLLRAGAAVLTLALLVALAAFAWRGWYTRYLTDDFCTAAALQDHGFVGAMQFHRAQWSGRFAYYPIKAIFESIGPQTARVTPGLLIALTIAAAYWFSRAVMPSRSLSIAAACALAFALVDAAPDKFGIYGAVMWETGALTYMLPVVLWLVWVGFFARGKGAVAGLVVMFIAGGLSETSLAAQGVLTAGALLVSLFRRDRVRARIAALALIATIAALAIVITAPGNEVRAQSPQLDFFFPALLDALRLANGFIGSHLFLEGASLLIVIAVATHARIPRGVGFSLTALAVVAAIIAIVPTTWVLHHPPPLRAWYIINAAAIAAVFGAFAGTRFKAAGAVLIVLSVIPVLSVLETYLAIPEARTGAMAVDEITSALATMRGRDAVVRSPWQLAERYFINDPTHWANACVCRYYGLRSLRVEHYRSGNRLQP